MKSPFHLSAAFRRLHGPEGFNGTLLDAAECVAIATNGEAVAIIPFPEGFQIPADRFIPTGDGNSIEVTPSSGAPPQMNWDWKTIPDITSESPAIFRIALQPALLLAVAEAMGAGKSVTLEFRDSQTPVVVTPDNSGAIGYLMPDGGEGLLVKTPGAGNSQSSPLPPPVINFSVARSTIEIHFGGKPEKSILDALKHPSLGFRYSGAKGTKRGVPPTTWYGPDNPFTREKVAGILGLSTADMAA